MAHTLNKIEVVTDYKHLQIREIIQVPRLDEDGEPVLNDEGKPTFDSGGYHRRVLQCDQTLADDEHQEIKDIVNELWTDEVKSAWATFKAEQAPRNPK